MESKLDGDEFEPYSGGSSDEYVAKKRKCVNISNWKRNQKKKLLATGKKHVNTRNKMVGPRVVGKDCKCKFKCFQKFNEQERTHVLSKFNEIGGKEMQDTYLCGLITT